WRFDAAISSRRSIVGASGRSSALGCGGLIALGQRPELFEIIKLAGARQHHVHDDVAEIDEHPLAYLLPFDANWAMALLFRFLNDRVRDRAHVPVGASA